MIWLPITARERAGLLRVVAGAWIAGSAGLCIAQEPATSGVTKPRGPVDVRNDPLRERSATENVVFGRIISSDEHRLILREGEGEDAIETEVLLSPQVRVYLNERPISLSDLPPNARVRIPRSDKPDAPISEVYVVNEEEPSEGNAPASESEQELTESDSPVGLGLVMEARPEGIIVASVRPDGPADKAGIVAGDEILSINEKTVGTPQEILAATADMEPDAAVTLRIRRDGTERNVSLTAQAGPEARDAVRTEQAAGPTRVARDEEAPRIATEKIPEVDLGGTLETVPGGIKVLQVDVGSPLDEAGVESGDLIKEAAGQSVVTPDSLFRVLNNFDPESAVELAVVRGTEELTLTLNLPAGHEKVLVDPAADTVNAARRDLGGNGQRGASPQSLEQIRQTLEVHQQQLKYLYDSLMQLAESAGVDRSTFGNPAYPFGVWPGIGLGGIGGTGNGSGLEPIGVDVNGNPIIGLTQDGIPIAIVGFDGNGRPILEETTFDGGEGGTGTGNSNDRNGDGIPDVDLDGDGVVDDLNGDGIADVDRDGDGFPPIIQDNSDLQQEQDVDRLDIDVPNAPANPIPEPRARSRQQRGAAPQAGTRGRGVQRPVQPGGRQPIPTPRQAPRAPGSGGATPQRGAAPR